MGLMGFARSGIRQYWHVWQVMQDTSKYAATPALGYASKMISLCVLIFLSLVAFVFWLGGLAEKSTFVATDRKISTRSEEHTSELQSRLHLVCRLLLEKKKKKTETMSINT